MTFSHNPQQADFDNLLIILRHMAMQIQPPQKSAIESGLQAELIRMREGSDGPTAIRTAEIARQIGLDVD